MVRAGNLSSGQRRFREIGRPLEETVKIQYFNPHAGYHLALAWFKLGERDKCQAEFERVKSFDPKMAAQMAQEFSAREAAQPTGNASCSDPVVCRCMPGPMVKQCAALSPGLAIVPGLSRNLRHDEQRPQPYPEQQQESDIGNVPVDNELRRQPACHPHHRTGEHPEELVKKLLSRFCPASMYRRP